MPGWGMSMLGFAALKKGMEGMIPGPTDTWLIGPETDYDVYVELGTSRIPSRPCVKFGAEKAMEQLDPLERRAANINALLRLLALRMEYEIKASMSRVIYAHPLGDITPTGNLRGSVEAVKQ